MQKALKGRRTKCKLAGALREALEIKPLERVRIHDLTDRCDIHRQTFYYHFADVYALFDWCVGEDGAALSAALAQAPGWREALDGLLRYIPPRRGYLLAILNRADPALRRRFFGQALAPVAEKAGAGGGVEAILLSLLEKWIRDGCKPPPEEMTPLLEQLLDKERGALTC